MARRNRIDSPSVTPYALKRRKAMPVPVLNLESDRPLANNWFKDVDLITSSPDAIKVVSPENLDGETLIHGCPDCQSPLSLRVWLGVADCWSCGASFSLDELDVYHQRQVRQKKRQSLTSVIQDADLVEAERWESAKVAVPPDFQSKPTSKPKTQVVHPKPWWESLPAMLASLLIHLLILILLALWSIRRDLQEETITLSTNVATFEREGDAHQYIDAVDNVAFDLPVPDQDQPQDESQRKALIMADQMAKQIRFDPNEPHPELPDLSNLKRLLGTENVQRSVMTRDPRVRTDMIRREGGTTLTEAAVARGLDWMARHQNSDGSWSLHRFHRAQGCRGQCRGAAHQHCDSAATSLCLLPFLGAGQTQWTGMYKDVVASGLRWLVDNQLESGDLRAGANHQFGMYAHGQGAIVLCEAYALTRDEALRQPAQKSIDYIIAAQHKQGGWRYQPGERGDTSVLGWQIMALHSARSAGLYVPDDVFAKAHRYLNSTTTDGSLYGYQPGHHPTETMTAEALLCRMYMGWTFDDPGLKKGVRFLANEHLPDAQQFNIYYWYYATQVMHHAGGRQWKKWNERMRDILVQSQVTSGHEAGSWAPQGPHGSDGGRIYVTALAVCTLEVYYRHAPIFRQIRL